MAPDTQMDTALVMAWDMGPVKVTKDRANSGFGCSAPERLRGSGNLLLVFDWYWLLAFVEHEDTQMRGVAQELVHE